MANPDVFDELSNRLKRPDSGIHTSLELSADHEKKKNQAEMAVKTEEQVDSGQDSDNIEHVDSSPTKKKGLFKTFKSIFQRKTKKNKKLKEQRKAQSEPDLLARENLKLKNDFSANEMEPSLMPECESPEKRSNSAERAQQKIRSSLRKLKQRSQKSDEQPAILIDFKKEDPPAAKPSKPAKSVPAKPSTPVKPAAGSPLKSPPEPMRLEFVPTSAPVTTSAAKDRIRIAPRDRRKPTRFRSPGHQSSSTTLPQISEENVSKKKNEKETTKLEDPSKDIVDGKKSTTSSEINTEEGKQPTGSFKNKTEMRHPLTSSKTPPLPPRGIGRSKSIGIPRNLIRGSADDISRLKSPPRRTKSTNSKETVPWVPRDMKQASRKPVGVDQNVLLSRSLGALNPIPQAVKPLNNKNAVSDDFFNRDSTEGLSVKDRKALFSQESRKTSHDRRSVPVELVCATNGKEDLSRKHKPFNNGFFFKSSKDDIAVRPLDDNTDKKEQRLSFFRLNNDEINLVHSRNKDNEATFQLTSPTREKTEKRPSSLKFRKPVDSDKLYEWNSSNIEKSPSQSGKPEVATELKTASEKNFETNRKESLKHKQEPSNEEITSVPEFNKISLRKTSKTNELKGKEVVDTSDDKKQKHSKSTQEQNHVTVISKTATEDFSILSDDVNDKRSKSLPRPLPVKQNESTPSWVKIAREKQHNEEESEMKKDRSVSLGAGNRPSMKPKPNVKPESLRLPTPPTNNKSLPSPKQSNSPAKCVVCDKTAYMFERCDVDNHTLHKTCAKCDVCMRQLNVGGIFFANEKVFCSQHKPS